MAAGGGAQPKTRTPHKDVGNEYLAVYPILRHTQVSDRLLDNLIPLQLRAAGGLKTEWWRARFNGATGSGEVMEREEKNIDLDLIKKNIILSPEQNCETKNRQHQFSHQKHHHRRTLNAT